MNIRNLKRALSLALAFVMFFVSFEAMNIADVKAEEAIPVWEEAEENSELVVPAYEDDEQVRVMIVFEEEAMVDAGYEIDDIASNKQAVSYSKKLIKKQNKIINQIEDEALNGEELNKNYSFTLLTNAVSADIQYGEIEAIKQIDGVEAVYVLPTYEICEEAEPDTFTSGEMVGSYNTWTSGYTGAGMRVAVIDTGLDTDHPSFAEDAFIYGLEETAETTGKKVEDYKLLTKEAIGNSLSLLNAKERYGSLTATDVYGSAKTPFMFNYVDNDLDVTHDNDRQGDHGTHVSGITTANKYVNNNGKYEAARGGVVGVAPDAQLFVMKVFGRNGGANTDDYFAAIEDAIVLGADVINLSLGTSFAGETSESSAADAYINEIMNKLEGTSVVVSISAGNASNWSQYSPYGLNFVDDVNADTVGSPGSYTNALTVASANNSGITANAATFQESVKVFYSDGADSNNKPFVSLDESGNGIKLDYVVLDSCGEVSDYASLDVEGKVVLVKRGNNGFAEKHDNAANAGAKACIVYNNQPGAISMDLSGSSATIPCASISQEDAESIKNASTYDSGTKTWSGEIFVTDKMEVNRNVADGYLMSTFSSWGVPGDLTLKPEITAPGGKIYSTRDKGSYGLMSGTSMAAPSITGISALVLQYIEENKLAAKNNISARTLAQSLIMSTAMILKEKDGEFYSPRRQGAGLANAQLATTSQAYILVGDKEGNDGKVKAELFDDPERKGEYSFDFTVYNMDSSKPLAYELGGVAMTEDVVSECLIANSSHTLDSEISFTSDNKSAVYDVDKNGTINIDDARKLLSYANGKTVKTVAACEDAFDFNSNGIIDTSDARIFYKGILNPSESGIDFSKQILIVEDKAEVSAKIVLSEDDRQYLDYYFENGMYIDAFVTLDGDIDLSIPALAFYGNWTDSSMFEPYDYIAYMYGSGNEYRYTDNNTDLENFIFTPTNYLTYQFAGESKKYRYIPNWYVEENEYIPNRNAMSSLSGDKIDSFAYTLIRNAADVTAQITDKDTGEIYYQVDTGRGTCAYYQDSAGMWKNTSAAAPLNWSATDAKGKPLPNGTKVVISVTAMPTYYNDASRVPGKGVSLEIPMTIDNEAPKGELVSFDDSKKTMTVRVEDDNYVAAVLLLNRDMSDALAAYSVDQEEAGVSSTLEFEYPETVFYVDVIDYAGNEVLFRVNKSGTADTEIASSIELSDENVSILKGSQYKVEANVGPENLVDDSVTWSSDNPQVALVDGDGVITAVGEGTTTITASTTSKNSEGASLTASLTVEVYTIDVDLRAIVCDEEGNTFFGSFNTGDTTSITRISEYQANPYIAATVVEDKIYAATDMDEEGYQCLYEVDPESYEATLLNDRYLGVDITCSPITGLLYSVYGNYLVIAEDKDYRTLDFSGVTSGNLVGCAYYVSTGTPETGYTESIFVTDEYGRLYRVDFDFVTGKVGYALFKETGISTNREIEFDSLYYEDSIEMLFYSVYAGANVETLYAIDINTRLVNELGCFEKDIWPVSGLYSWKVE